MATAQSSNTRARHCTRGGLGWALYEGGRMPFLVLLMGSVFVPYFATAVVGDPVEGQARVASFATIAGVIAALTAPLIGAAVDHLGPRKPWLASGTLLMAALIASLWWVQPGGMISIDAAVALLVAINILYGYTETLHNSMLVRAADDGGSVPVLSSLSLAIGNLTAIAAVGFFLWAFTGAGRTPLFGLDPDSYENVRIVGPFVAGLILAFALPLLLWTPDAPRAERFGRALRDALMATLRLPATLRRDRNGSLFLLARMIYADACAAITIFGGVVAAGILKWTPGELVVAGLLRAIGAALGAVAGGALNLALGPKRSLQIALAAMTLWLLVLVGTDTSRIAFFWAYDASMAAGSGNFNTLPDKIHLGLGALISISYLIIATSSRSLLAEIAPREATGTYFGLYALAGTATAWLAPLLVDWATTLFNNQQAGIVPVIGMFVVGFMLLAAVRTQDPLSAPRAAEQEGGSSNPRASFTASGG